MSTHSYLTPHQKLAYILERGRNATTFSREDFIREILEDLSQHYGVPNPIDKFSSTHTPTPKV